MSANDALTTTSAPDALTRYYCAKEREESAVLYINDAYLEAIDALEKLETENTRLRELIADGERHLLEILDKNKRLRELARFIMHQCNDGNPRCDECIGWNDGECVAMQHMHELGVD